MYESFFAMTQTPFLRNLPVSELYADSDTNEIHNRLLYAAQRQMFAVLVGDAGMGKTTALRKFKESLDSTEFAVLYLADSKLTPRHFYNGLLEQLGLETRFYRGDARKRLHQEIEIMRGVAKRKLVVIVDEGHLLSKEMLEEIRFLLNYKMDSENPLALILAGQTELWDKLKLQAYRAIRHRIDIQCFLTPYDFAQTKAYIEKQLEFAGHALCLERGIAVNTLANLCGVAPSTIYSMLNTKSKHPGVVSIQKICDGLGISVQEFFDDPLFENLEPVIK